VMSVFVLVRAYLSVHEHISAAAGLNFTTFSLLVICGRRSISSGGVVMRYILPVRWMTSFLHTMARKGA